MKRCKGQKLKSVRDCNKEGQQVAQSEALSASKEMLVSKNSKIWEKTGKWRDST